MLARFEPNALLQKIDLSDGRRFAVYPGAPAFVVHAGDHEHRRGFHIDIYGQAVGKPSVHFDNSVATLEFGKTRAVFSKFFFINRRDPLIAHVDRIDINRFSKIVFSQPIHLRDRVSQGNHAV